MHIEIQNFAGIVSKSVDVPEGEVTCIRGRSGSGKTTILRAILFAVTGIGKKIGTINGSKALKVTLQHKSMTIVRAKNPNSLHVVDGGVRYESDDAQNRINTLFGHNFEELAYIEQKSANSFLAMKPAEKLVFLETLVLNPSEFEPIIALIKKSEYELKDTYNTTKGELNIVQNEYSSNERKCTSILTDTLPDLTSTLSNLRALQTYKRDDDEIKRNMGRLELDIADISRKLADARDHVLSVSLLSSYAQMIEEYDRWVVNKQSIMMKTNMIEKRLRQHRAELSHVNASLQSARSTLNDRRKGIDINAVAIEMDSMKNNLLSSSEQDKYETSIRDYCKHVEIEQGNARLRTELDTLQKSRTDKTTLLKSLQTQLTDMRYEEKADEVSRDLVSARAHVLSDTGYRSTRACVEEYERWLVDMARYDSTIESHERLLKQMIDELDKHSSDADVLEQRILSLSSSIGIEEGPIFQIQERLTHAIMSCSAQSCPQCDVALVYTDGQLMKASSTIDKFNAEVAQEILKLCEEWSSAIVVVRTASTRLERMNNTSHLPLKPTSPISEDEYRRAKLAIEHHLEYSNKVHMLTQQLDAYKHPEIEEHIRGLEQAITHTNASISSIEGRVIDVHPPCTERYMHDAKRLISLHKQSRARLGILQKVANDYKQDDLVNGIRILETRLQSISSEIKFCEEEIRDNTVPACDVSADEYSQMKTQISRHRDASTSIEALHTSLLKLEQDKRALISTLHNAIVPDDIDEVMTNIHNNITRLEWKTRLERMTAALSDITLELDATRTLIQATTICKQTMLQKVIDTINANLAGVCDQVFDQRKMNASITVKKDKLDIELIYNNIPIDLKSLSGGEYDRLSLCVALAIQSVFTLPIVMYDEVLSALDADTASDIISKLRTPNHTIVFILHNVTDGIFPNVINMT